MDTMATGFGSNPDTSDAEPLVAPVPEDSMLREIAALPRCQSLYVSNQYNVYIAQRSQVPNVMEEIGRLRELSFRAVGEGTGKATDIDCYDDWYFQLFTWDNQARQIVGAYRLCMTDVVTKRHGVEALYTHSLFDFDADFVRGLPPAIELGRSFVRPEMQGSGRGLALLWRGIGQLIAMRPRYRTLFGPVSVSASYTMASRQLIANSLSRGSHRHPLAELVGAKRPVAPLALSECEVDARRLSRRVQELEADQRGLPILLREYMKLGGRFLAFSTDPDFQNALDGLVLVDLDATKPRLLALYMGPENYERFARAATARGAERRSRAIELQEAS